MDCCRAVDDSAVAEWVVAQVTVRVCSVELRCWRELGCGVAASSCIVGRTRSLYSRTVVVRFVVRTSLWTIVVWTVLVRAVGHVAVIRTVVVWTDIRTIAVVVRLVVLAVVRTILVLVAGINTALGADIAHMVVIVSASVHAGRVSAALSRIAVGRRLPVR